MPTEPAAKLPLSAWLKVFCPVYRGALVGLVALNLVSAVGVFVELQLLRALTVALSGPAPANACTARQWAQSGFSFQSEPCGGSLPAFLLVIYAVSILAQSAVDLIAYTYNSRLAQRARRDVERELLSNLLRQDDAFYVRRSPAEIVSRLGGDLQRVGARRQNFTEGSATALTIVATLLVLVTQSWLAAAIGLAISLIGVASAEPRMRKLRELDRETTLSDERVKAAFEDTLQGAAEIQVSGALTRMLARFGALQKARDAIALDNAGLNNRNVVAQKLTFTLGFIAIVALFVFAHLFGQPSGSGGATAGLIVLLVSSLPELYFKFAEMTQRFTQFRIAGESVRRLMQYEAAPRAAAAAPAADADAIRLEGVRYVFSGGETLQGGPQGLNCVIPGRGLTGVVGAAGSGKSTLIKLILDRQPHVAGAILLPAADGRPLFAYLPQRPVLFDATIGDNLFLGDPPADPLARVAHAESLARLGLIDLIRLKGLDARPRAALPAGLDIAALRRDFRSAAEAALGAPLKTLGAEAGGPRQMVIERQLGCAVDQEAFAERLAAEPARAIVTSMSGLACGAALAALAQETLRATAPLIAKAGDPAEYNGVAAFAIAPPIFTLRRMALEMLANGGPPGGATSPLLVAIGLSLKLEEVQGDIPPGGEARDKLAALVEGLSAPLDEGRLNPLLPWRENLIFAAPEGANSRDAGAIDRALIDRLAGSPLDAAVIGAGFDYAVGRQGGRLSGGQQQMIGLGRALLTQARFLVLDEPSSAFHPQLRQLATQALRREAQTRGVVVITHDLDLARACDRLIFVRDGAIAGEGGWDQLLAGADGFSAWVAESGARA